MLIGELSERAGASTRSLRYYERKGIISGERLQNGYRDFDEAQAERVRTAQFYLGLGISTDMVARILNCQGNDPLPEAGGRCEDGFLTFLPGEAQGDRRADHSPHRGQGKPRGTHLLFRGAEVRNLP